MHVWEAMGGVVEKYEDETPQEASRRDRDDKPTPEAPKKEAEAVEVKEETKVAEKPKKKQLLKKKLKKK